MIHEDSLKAPENVYSKTNKIKQDWFAYSEIDDANFNAGYG